MLNRIRATLRTALTPPSARASATNLPPEWNSHGEDTVAYRTGTSTSTVQFLVPKYQNSSEATVNAVDQNTWSLRRFGPFETERANPVGVWPAGMDKGYGGGTKDASTGLTHLGAREYDPQIGRFTSVDPAFNASLPESWKGFAYAENNPIDRSGAARAPPCTSWLCKAKKKGAEFVSKHRATIAAAAVGVGCGVAIGWTGVGGAGCAVASGAVYGLVHHAQHTPRDQWTAGGFLKEAAIGGVTGLVTHGVAGLAAKAAAPVIQRVAPRIAGKIAGLGAGKGGSVAKGNPAAKPLPAAAKKIFSSGRARSAPAKGKCSFVPGTAVLMADGTTKPIDQVRVGDKVIATDPATGKTAPRTVTTTFSNTGAKHLVKLTIDTDGKRGAKTGTLTATDNHPFWTPKTNQWTPAGHLKPGMWLRTSAGTYVQISAVKTWHQHQRVHNLTVDADHTYYALAGSAPVLVHNCGPTDADVDPNIVYRALAKGEDPALGLTARDPSAVGVSPLSHVEGKKASPWISTSKLPSVAFEKYNSGHGIVAIDLTKVIGRVEDISGGFPGKGRFDQWARRDQEVLIFGSIHPDAIIGFW
ncbi:polymorphic toxin-type HINT domain-containing protein [Actinomadura yumaensis]|uniref:polymorphic toxin-type HINT domain-containing protein n=1 Tax=Actinomadura yumaensis TaxID=111807 RepID=UPI00361135DF